MRTKYFVFAILTVLALTLSACGTTVNQAAPTTPRTLNVNGMGVVYLTPDIVYINVGVSTQKTDATDAVNTNKEQTTKVIQAVKKFGVEDKDIRTTNFSIWSSPQYDSNGQLTGEISYSVDNSVSITVRDIDKLGALLDAAINAGANSIYSIQFDVEDKTEASKQARALAMTDAKTEAQELADVAGVGLGEIQTINYYETSPSPYTDMGGRGGGGMDAAASAPVPIQPGQLAVSVTVSITYGIK
ncbi:MAG: SIMPL domain-containing protein [Anaerolineales bacterium]|nr:SIMPL domain-containing protein [Anaerolineales bacterium]